MFVTAPVAAADVDLSQAVVLGEESCFVLFQNPASARIGVGDSWPIRFDVVDELGQGDRGHLMVVRIEQEMVGLLEAMPLLTSHFLSVLIRSISSSSLFE